MPTTYVTEIASWQGQMFVGELDDTDNVAYEYIWLGDVEDVSITPTEEFQDFVESWTGYNFMEHRWRTSLSLDLTFTLNHLVADNFGLAFSGSVESVTGDDVADEELNNGEDLVIGKYYPLSHGAAGATDLVIEDSTATPKTLTLGTHYLLTPCNMICIIALPTTPAKPWKASYTYPAHSQVNMLDLPPIVRSVRLEGINVAIPGNKMLTELYRVNFSVSREMMLLAKQRSKIPMQAKVMADMRRWDGTSNFATMFGRVI